MGPFIPTLLIWVGFALRVTALGDKSLWWDEGHSVTMASYSFPEIAAYARQDIHVPLYFFVLKLWLAVAGDSEMAIRFPSVIFGALTLAAIWKGGQKMFGAPAAVAAVTIAALSPLHLAYSQEARMYSLAALAGALTLYLIFQAVEGGQALHWISYAFAAATGLYSHYYVGLTLAAQSAWAGASALVGGKRTLLRIGISALGAFALTLILYQPWWETAWRQLAGWGSTWQPPPPTSVMLSLTIAALGTGEPDMPGWPGVVAGLTLGTLVVAFIASMLERHHRSAVLLCFLTLAAVTVGAYLAASARTFFHPRYLLPALPAFFLLCGYAIGRVGQWHRPAGAALLAGWGVVSLFGVAVYYTTPKDDARAVAAFLRQEAGPDAVAIVDSEQPLPYYARGDPRYTYLSVNEAGDEPLAAFVQRVTAGKTQAYYVRWRGSSYDPKGLISFLLSVNGDQKGEQDFNGYHVESYGLDAESPKALPQWSMGGLFQGIISPAGVSYRPPSGERNIWRPGSKLPIAIRWWKIAISDSDLVAQVALVDSAGRSVAGVDKPIISASLQPTSRWNLGEQQWNYYLLPVPAGLVPGRYRVAIRVYDLANQRRLQVDGGLTEMHINVGDIERTIGLEAAASLPISH
ncbi:MAG: glycosyltransferase family 39 protein, partial [Chloroflexi bacterium]|nr:glycosyltransferase family 39 protein [Chloroflexota bacterium]